MKIIYPMNFWICQYFFCRKKCHCFCHNDDKYVSPVLHVY